MNGLVVDASVAIKWFIDEPDSAEAVAVLRHPISAPDLLAPECANILWKKVGRGELRADEAEAIALALEGAVITLHSTRPYLAAANPDRLRSRMRSVRLFLSGAGRKIAAAARNCRSAAGRRDPRRPHRAIRPTRRAARRVRRLVTKAPS